MKYEVDRQLFEEKTIQGAVLFFWLSWISSVYALVAKIEKIAPKSLPSHTLVNKLTNNKKKVVTKGCNSDYR